MKDINTIKDIVHIIYELTITVCTVIIAWPKIKKHFRERKKTLVQQIMKQENTDLEYFGIKNVIIYI